MELSHRIEHLSSKMESTLHSARGANSVLIEEKKSRIKEFLSKLFEKKYRTNTSRYQYANLILCCTSAMLSGDWSKKVEEANMETMDEHNANKNNLRQKFDHAINKIDSMSATRLNQIAWILKEYDLERILDTINAECVEAKPIRRQNTSRP